MKKHRDKQKADAKKQQVLDAAMHCFAHNGFHKTNMPQIALNAGISIGNIYGYFPSKNAIIIAVVERIISGIKAQLEYMAQRYDSSKELIQAQVRAHIQQRFDSNSCALSAEVMAEAHRNEEVAAAMRVLDADIRETLVKICLEDHPQWTNEMAKSKINLLILALYGYEKSKSLHPSLDEGEILASLDVLIDGLFTQ